MPTKCIVIFKYGPSRQHGAALLIMLVILVVGIAAVLVSSLTSSAVKTARDDNTAAVLAQAKEALIGYAVTYSDTHGGQAPGYLPCPDPNGTTGVNGEGSSETCGSKNVSALGRLPWKTLGLSPLRDGNGECLWYAVAGTYKNNPMTDLMNWDTNGQFQVFSASNVMLTGQLPDSYAVAIIFSPGVSLSNQNRSPDGTTPICGGNYTASNYLDSDATIGANNAAPSSIANAISQFFAAGATSNINDRIIFITKNDIWNAIKKRNDFQPASPNNPLNNMTLAAATCLASAGSPKQFNPSYVSNINGWIPSATTLKNYNSTCANLYNTWNNWWSNWADHLFYAANSPIVNVSSYDSAVIFANQKLSGQNRRTTTPDDYLEASNLTSFKNGGTVYQTSPLSSTFNDVLFCVSSSTAISCP